jgi:mono/diheme cytochrome c family protein
MTRVFPVLASAALLACQPVAAENVPPTTPARALTDVVFETSEARRARGEYLTNGLLQCFVCHSERDWDKPGAPPKAGKAGAGVVWRDDGEHRLVAPNLTPDVETGIGRWTDDMLARAIREGVGHDGRALHPAMWYSSFRGLADEDLAAVIVYLRSLYPIANPLPRTQLADDEAQAIAAMPRPLIDPVAAPDRNDAVAYGTYLVGNADCGGCHTGWEAPRMAGLFAGGNRISRGQHQAFSSKITPDPTGIGYGPDVFVAVMRSGKGGSLNSLMPWVAFSTLTDADLRAMFAALETVYPVRHLVNNAEPATECPVCGERHGGGERNTLVMPPAVQIDTRIFDAYVGDYYSDEYDFTLHITRAGDRLMLQEDDGAVVEMIPRTETRFVVPGGIAPIRFVRAADGAVNELVSEELPPLKLRRIVSTDD